MGASRDDARRAAPLPWCPVEPGPGPDRSAAPAPAHPVLPWLPGPDPLAARPVARPPSATTGVARPAPGPWSAGALLTRPGAPRLVALVAVAALVVAVVTGALHRTDTRTVTTPFLSFAAPAGWTAENPEAPGPPDAGAPLDAPALVGTVRGPGYDCGGPAVRGYAAAALLPADTVAGSAPADRAERLARWFALTSYATPGAPPALTVAPPRPVRVPGPDGPVDATVTAVTAQVTAHGGCAAGGTVLALAAPVSGGAAVLLVAGDTGGGPSQPAPPDRATLDAVLASVRLSVR